MFATDLQLNRSLHLVYIDDVGILSPSLADANRTHNLVIEAYKKRGFIVKQSKEVKPIIKPVDLLGTVIDGELHTLKVCANNNT